MGIPPEDLERVFEPFERGRAHAVRSLPGTGLGLTITKLLTQIMGGEITVRSTPGEGTTFLVRLLLSHAMHDLAETPARRRVHGYSGPAEASSLRTTIRRTSACCKMCSSLWISFFYPLTTAARAWSSRATIRRISPVGHLLA